MGLFGNFPKHSQIPHPSNHGINFQIIMFISAHLGKYKDGRINRLRKGLPVMVLKSKMNAIISRVLAVIRLGNDVRTVILKQIKTLIQTLI